MNIAKNILNLEDKIQKLSQENITIVAVSKGQSLAAIREAYQAGLRNFAESYWQEAKAKIHELQDLEIIWHFIGPIQSNKAKEIATNFSWVHSLDREKVALLLNQHRPCDLEPLNVCIQINLDEEKSKSGVNRDNLNELLTCISELPRLKLRGLMAIPKQQTPKSGLYQSFYRLKLLNLSLNPPLDCLSMGMSDDFEEAILAGATMLRIGKAIFGERPIKR